MKADGVSKATGTMDTLFFQAVDRATLNPGQTSFKTVFNASRSDYSKQTQTKEFAAENGIKQAAGDKNFSEDSLSVNASKEEPAKIGKVEMTSEEKQTVSRTEANGKTEQQEQTPSLSTDSTEADKLTEETEMVSMEIISVIVITIRQIVIEGLDITDEQFEEALKACSLDELQLLEPDNLKDFMLSMTETKDVSEFLTKEPLIQAFQMVKTALEELDLDQFGITREQLNQYMDFVEETITQGEDAQFPVPDTLPDAKEEPGEMVKTVQKNESDPLADKIVVDDQTKTVSSDDMPVVNSVSDKNADADTNDNADADADDENQSMSKEKLTTERSVRETRHDGQNVTEHFATQLSNHSASVTHANVSVSENVVMYRQIVTQIVEQVKVTIQSDQTSMSMQLNPESLGKLLFHVTSKQGVVTASFVVQNDIAREAIEANIEAFKQTLHEQGTKVEAVEVTVSDFNLEEKGMQQEAEKKEEENDEKKEKSSRRQISLSELEEAEELSEEDEAIANAMLQSGSTVEFRA